jgi:hypothetical protein
MAKENKEFSQLDLGGVLRSAHEDKNKSLRVSNANSSVPARYSRVDLTYNASDSVTNAKFYEGTLAEVRHVLFTADVAGSLNNTYFTLYSENDESVYHVWYNVSGGGIDPAPVGSCGIEIPIETNDSSAIIKLATQRCLELFSDDFRVQELAANKLKIENARLGEATSTTDVGTGFTITTIKKGEEKLVKSIDIPFDGITKYTYNTQEKRFEVFPIVDVEVSGEVDVKNPDTLVILNTAIALKDTEVSQVLPDNTKRFRISVRGSRAGLRLAYTAGGTATTYRTISRGSIWESHEVDVANGTTLYLLSTADNVVVEIEVWTRI